MHHLNLVSMNDSFEYEEITDGYCKYTFFSICTDFSYYQTSQYTKNYLKAKIHCWKKESSIKFLWEAIRQLYEKKDQGSTGIKWCPSILQLHLSINVDCRWRCNIMLGSLDYDKKM